MENEYDLFIKGYDIPNNLTEKETKKIFIEYYNGNKNARDELINHNIRLVMYIVFNKFYKTPYEYSDLISIGLLGLTKAVDTFMTKKEIKFSSYASICIINEILQHIRKNKNYIKYEEVNSELLADNIEYSNRVEYPHEEIYKKDLYNEVKTLVEQLPEREKQIIKLTYGFDTNKTHKQTEVGQILKMEQSHISRKLNKTLSKLKQNIIESEKI